LPESNYGGSANSIAYQQHVTGLPPGLAVEVNDVMFDGCRDPDGPLLDAKAAYAKFMKDGQIRSWFEGADDWPKQLERQSKAARAAGMRVEWHIQEEAIADCLRPPARDWGNIDIIWDKWP